MNEFYNDALMSFNFNESIFCHLRLDDVAHKTDHEGSICSRYYKLLLENDKKCYNKFYDFVNNHSPLSKEKINMMINNSKNIYQNKETVRLSIWQFFPFPRAFE